MQHTKAIDTEASPGAMVYRHRLSTRLTHLVWATCLFFLLLSGLQILNAHPVLYLGDQSRLDLANAMLQLGSGEDGDSPVPAWLTLPADRDLATGRVVHFFFAWLLSATILLWLVLSLVNGHLRRDLLPTPGDLKALPRDIADHLRLRFHHSARYNVLQKLSYAGVLLVLLPLMIASGLAMSPGFNAVAPWLTDLFLGRQTARSVHFLVMILLVAFFAVHIVMILAAGPLNELRSIVTGWYRIDAAGTGDEQ